MIICGTNRHSQLTTDSNNKNVDGTPIVSPPIDSNLELSLILSFSIYNEHSVWISKKGQAHAIGDNRSGQIIGSIRKESLPGDSIFNIEDKEGKSWVPISAVCGQSYTLYLVSFPSDKTSRKLVYSHINLSKFNPLFLNINDRQPVALYGGRHTAACIDSEGCVIVIRNTIIKQPFFPVESISLPSSEKAVSVACCDKVVIALSSNGRLFECSLMNNDYLVFVQIKDLIGVKIVGISGSHSHFLAVSSEGFVFGRGSNKHGKLCMPSDILNTNKFTVLESLKQKKIQSAFAGYSHSLFITQEGMVIGCGDNYNGNLLFDCKTDSNDYFFPVETSIKTGATFCIAGWNLSVIFIDCKPPKNCPNKSLLFGDYEVPQLRKMKSYDASINVINDDKIRISELEKQVSDQNARIKKLEKELKKERLRADALESQSMIQTVKIYDSTNITSIRTVCEVDDVDDYTKIYEVVKEETFEKKEIKVEQFNDEKQQKLIDQLNILNMIEHPNILKIEGFYFNKTEMTASFLYKQYQTTLDQAVMGDSISNVDAVCSIYQLAEAFKYAHFVGVFHGYLTPENIILDPKGIIKVGGFGCSILRKFDANKFTSPEIVKDLNFDEKADVYSFAIIILFVLSGGELPKSKNVGKKPSVPDYFNDYSKELILKCCNIDPKKRPGFNVICKELDLNEYRLTNLTKSEINDVKLFIENYKKQIPSY